MKQAIVQRDSHGYTLYARSTTLADIAKDLPGGPDRRGQSDSIERSSFHYGGVTAKLIAKFDPLITYAHSMSAKTCNHELK
jgi:hypothetical protein